MLGKIARTLTALTLALTLTAAPADRAQAQLPVIDPANLAQSLIQVANMIEQVKNQVRQIEQATAMLKQNPLQLSPELSQSIKEAREVFDAAQKIAFEVEQVGEDLRTLYPETWEKYDLEGVLKQSDQWRAETRSSLQRSMEAEAHAAQSIAGAQSRIDRALKSSSDAEGQTGAIQASNQLLGVTAGQLAEIHTLLVAQGRSLETERMERVAREERAKEIQRRAFPSKTGRDMTPAPSAF